tara:strand:+ start:107 stop:472 length:366 start_codon:yes stop_codon:yes gene_type:complete
MNLKINNMSQAVEIIIPIAGMSLTFGIVYVAVTAWHRQKMAMIEAGMNPKKDRESKHSKIRTALLFLLVPTGIFIGNTVSDFYPVIDGETMGLLFAFLFGGIALVAAYFLERKFDNQNQIN